MYYFKAQLKYKLSVLSAKCYLVVLENEESLHKCEQKMHDVDQNENLAFTRFCRNSLKVGSDMKSV